MPSYDLFPGVDASYNFPPEIILALVQNPAMRNTVIPMTQAVRNNLTGPDLWDGRLIMNVDTDRVNRYDLGTASWITLAEISDTLEPAGIIKQYGGTVAPAAHAICDGSLLARIGPGSRLFDVIGTTFNIGGELVTDYRLPNFKGRIPIGRDVAQTEFDTMGETGGEKTHILTVAEEPSHAHTATTGPDGGVDHLHSNSINGVGDHAHAVAADVTGVQTGGGGSRRGGAESGSTSGNAGTHNHSINNGAADRSLAHGHGTTINATGGGLGHNNLQPYIIVNYIITL
jgi:microcystin-dependent protein